jgi:hypothetical protein
VLVFYREGVRWPLLADGHRRVYVAAALGTMVPVVHSMSVDAWLDSRVQRWSLQGPVRVRSRVDRDASPRRGYLVACSALVARHA